MKNKSFDLSTNEGANKALLILESECLNAFINAGLTICPFAVVRIGDSSVDMGIIDNDKSSSYYGRLAFGSEITIYGRRDEEQAFLNQENSINFGTCGSFTPKQKEPYWRTIHAASVVSNWDVACSIVNEFCAKRRALNEQIQATRTEPVIQETITQSLRNP